MPRQTALLLVGPTGSGKTPLGELLQGTRLADSRVLHFDFGACLRRVSEEGGSGFGLSPGQTRVVLDSLRTGALLQDESFPIAETILRAVMRQACLRPHEWLLLNGLPRHLGQAEAMEAIVDIRAVIHLHADAEVVRQRIALNTGDDRKERTDDSLDAIRSKIAVFEARTLPLLDYYRTQGVVVVTIPVGTHTSAAEAARALSRAGFPRG